MKNKCHLISEKKNTFFACTFFIFLTTSSFSNLILCTLFSVNYVFPSENWMYLFSYLKGIDENIIQTNVVKVYAPNVPGPSEAITQCKETSFVKIVYMYVATQSSEINISAKTL